ncbi:hypothetical protein Tsubulata_011813 [Turnera subulata]|uniref:Glycosyl hydrolase family 13 catalytic domain-containing protein n=1 Tax=Turnera subulata TaxID=218843 RepID=A0A9Q0FCU4_9ROSI|nr:hypothetical protein Tsubulata_011813 [Turnera subulata]
MAALCPLTSVRPCSFSSGAMESIKVKVAANYKGGQKVVLGFGRMVAVKKLFLGEVAPTIPRTSCPGLASRVLAASRVSVVQTQEVRSEVDELKTVSKYLFRTEIGGHVKVSVRKKNGKYAVCIEVSSLEVGTNDYGLVLTWGIYRSNSASFIPLDSQQSASHSRTVDTPLIHNSSGQFALELEFQAKQTPFYLSFLLKFIKKADTSGLEIRSHRKVNFCVPVGLDRGHPYPLGLSFSNDGSMNFAFVSRSSKNVVLCLYDDTTGERPALELDLDPYVNRSGDVWHASLEGAWAFVSYGYRCKNAALPGDTDAFDAEPVVLDPYAKIIVNSIADHETGLFPKYLGRLCKEPTFDWTGDVRPNLPMEKLVVYRLNVKRFTESQSSKLYSDVVGTFDGVAEKLNHFKSLGVNAVLLEPIFPFAEQQGPYFPCHFFSPASLLGPSGGSVSAISSMKEMVKKLHAHGLEVFLEVVFTHTDEGGALQGIDDASYYYANRVPDLESRNALNCNYPIVQTLILDSLRHWVTEFHIDGFCFMNASLLLRGFHGETLSRPPLVESIAFDPLLSNTKIIADCWDPQELVLEETHFPHWKRWAEINAKFCSDVRIFLKGEGLLSDLATRLCGSGDIFSGGRGPAFSFNFVARNSGLPLVDLVSFSSDELASELSWNCGEEGPTNKTPVLERRLKQIRNYLFILFISLGVPVLNMGDECGQSSGASTSYSDRKPFDWNALSTGFGVQTTQFISFLSSFRMRRSDLFQKGNFLKEENIEWHGSDQSTPNWEDPLSKFLAMTLKADRVEGELIFESSDANGDLFIAFNAARHPESITLPPVAEGMAWHRLVDTALPFPGFFTNDGEPVGEQMDGLFIYKMKSHSCLLFEAKSVGE